MLQFSRTVGEVLAYSVCYFSYDVWVYNFGLPDICVSDVTCAPFIICLDLYLDYFRMASVWYSATDNESLLFDCNILIMFSSFFYSVVIVPSLHVGARGIEQLGCPHESVCESVSPFFFIFISSEYISIILMKLITVNHYQIHVTLMTLRRSLGQRSRPVPATATVIL